ncbi:Uncharacterised protein [Candidatus Burarchaeum australiense]|nr:Uncharacterised protein [Candidatus Burarchaeum australiense]
MKIDLSTRKTMNENAARYYEESKTQRAKADGVRKAIADTQRRLSELEEKIERRKAELLVQQQRPVKLRREKKWHEKFHHFTTSDGFLVVAGGDAKQNETLVAHHLEPADLFMHAEIHGAPATIIKDGQNAPERSLLEAAQFSASYSSAWKNELAAVDVYAVKPDQVSKTSHGEFVPKGGFMISGERQWFKHTKLGLRLGIGEEGVPFAEPESKNSSPTILLQPGGTKEKGELAKELAKK